MPLVVVRREEPGPGVEELNRLRAGLDLRLQVVRHDQAQLHHQRVEEHRILMHEALESGEVLGSRALDHVRRERERSAGESDQGHRGRERPAEPAHGLHDEPERFERVGPAEPAHVVRRPHRVRDHRGGVELQLDPHRLDRNQDVGEENRRVEAEAADRLERHLDGEVRRLAEREEINLLANLAIFRKIAARLTHEPDRGGLHALTAAGPQEERVRPGAGLGGRSLSWFVGAHTVYAFKSTAVILPAAGASAPSKLRMIHIVSRFQVAGTQRVGQCAVESGASRQALVSEFQPPSNASGRRSRGELHDFWMLSALPKRMRAFGASSRITWRHAPHGESTSG